MIYKVNVSLYRKNKETWFEDIFLSEQETLELLNDCYTYEKYLGTEYFVLDVNGKEISERVMISQYDFEMPGEWNNWKDKILSKMSLYGLTDVRGAGQELVEKLGLE